MKVRISYSVEVSPEYRRAIRHYRGRPGRASRTEVKEWFRENGNTMNDDLRLEHGPCCWGEGRAMNEQSGSDHGYTVDDHGIIRSPGKFEGEPVYLLHFYDLIGDGAGDTHWDGDAVTDFFTVNSEDVARYPDLDGVYGLAIWESRSGFVYHQTYATQQEYEAAIERVDIAGGDEGVAVGEYVVPKRYLARANR